MRHMKKIKIFLFFAIFALLFSCVHVYKEDKNGYTIEKEKRTLKLIGMNNIPIDETRYEYYIANRNKRSAIAIGYVIEPLEHVTLYITGKLSVKSGQTFPIDDKAEMDLLYYVIREIKRNDKHNDITNIQISMKTCGAANLSTASNYWKTKRFDIFFQQPLFCKIRDAMAENGYYVYEISKNDFYPIGARDLACYHILPDSCDLDDIGIDGIVVLKCKKKAKIKIL